MIHQPSANIFDFSSLSRLKQDSIQGPSKETIETVAAQFESLLIEMLLKSMREANEVFESDIFGESSSHQKELYEELYDKQLALQLAQGSGLGLKKALIAQMTQNAGLQEKTTFLTDPPKHSGKTLFSNIVPRQSDPRISSTVAPTVPTPTTKTFFETFESPRLFIDHLLDMAQKTAQALGVDPKLLIAQAALETGWGKKMVHHNLFGIKATPSWKGLVVHKTTVEFDGVGMQKQKAPFRAYTSFEESFEDYARFLQQDRYSQVRSLAKDPKSYLTALQDAGYATDPEYAAKILRIYEGVLLHE